MFLACCGAHGNEPKNIQRSTCGRDTFCKSPEGGGSLLFGTPLMPGMNGAYYLVQARAVITRGTLELPDLPLIFYVQALLWLCLLLLFLHRWMTVPKAGNAIGVLCFWGLSAMTHIGVFGATVMFGGLAIGFFIVRQRGSGWRVLWPLLAAEQ